VRVAAIFLILSLSVSASSAAAGGKDSLVDVTSVAPGIAVEMPYATRRNFTGRVVYDCGRCFLQRRSAEKLAVAERYLAERGFSLKMWDCYRPLSVQKVFWSLVPDTRYVADPKTGSRHNRGNAVDVTLVDASGKEVEMPTGFDDFSSRAASSATGVTAAAKKNREILSETMRRAGFRQLDTEWWHFDDPEGRGEVVDVPLSELCR